MDNHTCSSHCLNLHYETGGVLLCEEFMRITSMSRHELTTLSTAMPIFSQHCSRSLTFVLFLLLDTGANDCELQLYRGSSVNCDHRPFNISILHYFYTVFELELNVVRILRRPLSHLQAPSSIRVRQEPRIKLPLLAFLFCSCIADQITDHFFCYAMLRLSTLDMAFDIHAM